jgi:hypothetical protein
MPRRADQEPPGPPAPQGFDIRQRIRIAERAEMAMSRPFSRGTRVSAGDFATLVESDSSAERIFASVEYARLPPANNFFVRVFVNLPSASSGTPTDVPRYAGSFAFFGTSGGTHSNHAPPGAARPRRSAPSPPSPRATREPSSSPQATSWTAAAPCSSR